MNDMLNQVMLFASVLAAIVLAFLQMVKATVSVPKNFIPIIGLGYWLDTSDIFSQT